MKKYFIVFLLLGIISYPVSSIELDASIDDEIRRTYDPSKLEQSLPALPKTTPSQPQIQTKTVTSSPKSNSNSSLPPKALPVESPASPQLGVKKLPNDYKYDKFNTETLQDIHRNILMFCPQGQDHLFC